MKRVAVLLMLVPTALAADEVRLRGGGRISGEIVERTETTVTVDFGAGRMTVPLANVESIDERLSPLGEYRQRAATLDAGDVEGWDALGRWAAQRALSTQSREAYRKALAAAPDDEEANRALGKVRLDGQWVSLEESYRAQGMVQVGGEWMTPAARDRMVAEQAAQQAADQKELDDELAAREQELEADRAERDASDAAFWAGSHIPSGGMVYWGWGTGPTVWPYPQPTGGLP